MNPYEVGDQRDASCTKAFRDVATFRAQWLMVVIAQTADVLLVGIVTAKMARFGWFGVVGHGSCVKRRVWTHAASRDGVQGRFVRADADE